MNYKTIQKNGFIVIFLITMFYVVVAFLSDFDKLISSFQNIQLIYLPLILVLVIISIFLKSERQRFLLRSISIDISMKDSFIIFNAGQSLLATPGSVGNVVKSYLFKEKFRIPFSKTIPVILVEKYYDMVGIISIIFLFLIFRFDNNLIVPIITIIAIIIFVTITIRNKELFLIVTGFLKKIPKINKFAHDIIEANKTISFLTAKRQFFTGWSISVISWMIDATAVYFCFISFNLTFDILDTTLIGLTSLILGTLSFLPGGIGITEGSMIGLIIKHDVSLSIATALVMYVRLNTIWFSTFLGFLSTKIILKKNV